MSAFHETASAAVAYVEHGYDDKAMWVGAEFITLTGCEAERLVSMEIAGYFIVRKQDGIDFVPFNPAGKIPAFVPHGSKDGD